MWFAWTSGRASGRVKISDIAALPVQTGAAIRHARLFHPTGVLANGTLARIAATGEGLPMVSGEVVGRVSKVSALPGALPDIAGHGLADAAATATLHTLGRVAAVDHRRGAGRYPAAAADILVGDDILQPAAGISGRAVVVTRPAGHHHRRTGRFAGHHHRPNRAQRNRFRLRAGRGHRRFGPLARLLLRRSSRPAGTWRLNRWCTARQV